MLSSVARHALSSENRHVLSSETRHVLSSTCVVFSDQTCAVLRGHTFAVLRDQTHAVQTSWQTRAVLRDQTWAVLRESGTSGLAMKRNRHVPPVAPSRRRDANLKRSRELGQKREDPYSSKLPGENCCKSQNIKICSMLRYYCYVVCVWVMCNVFGACLFFVFV